MNIKTTLKSSVAAAALFAVVAPAHAGSISNGNDTASVSLSGQFNQAVWYHDNGDAAGVKAGSANGPAISRARLIAKGKLNEAVSVTGLYEWNMSGAGESGSSPADAAGTNLSTASTATSGTTTNATLENKSSDAFFTLRHAMVKFDHKQLGAVSIGHTSDAADGASENGGVGNLQYGTTNLWGNGVHVFNSASARSNGYTDNLELTDFAGAGEAGDRNGLIRYDTPTIAGFGLAASYDEFSESAIGGSFVGKFADFTVSAKAAYAFTAGSSAFDSELAGGAQIGHASGISIFGNYALDSIKASGSEDAKSWNVGASYAANLTSMGATTFMADYSEGEASGTTGRERETWTVGVDQSTDAGVSFYGLVQNSDLSATGVNYDDVMTVVFGSKFLF